MTTKITQTQRAENRIKRLEEATASLRSNAFALAAANQSDYRHTELCRAARKYAAAVRAVQKGGKP